MNNYENSGNIAEIEVSYKSKVKPGDRVQITNSRASVEVLRSVWSGNMELYEEFVILCLNRANKVLGWVKVSQGGITGTVVDSRLIFGIALKAAASSIILRHNHPSGNTKPSDEDISITKRLREAGKLLDIAVLDHVILTAESYYSFADENLI